MKKRRYKVRYARLVIMETIVEAVPSKSDPDEPRDYLDDGRLPSVFAGIAVKDIGTHVTGVQDYEPIWEVQPCERGRG